MFSFWKNLKKHGAMLALLCLALGAGRPAIAADYVIQPEDVLSIRVNGEPGLSKNYTVSEKGDIEMDRVGKVKLAGLTAKQAEETLTKELTKYLKLFELSLSVVGEVGNRVLVYGEVARPGSTKIRGGDKLLDVLAAVGQPTGNADTKRIVVGKKGGQKVETVDLDAVLKDLSLNVSIEPGDYITVPSKISRNVRVDGEVARPGPLSLENISTVYQAIMSAGPTEKADWTRVAIRKKESDVPLVVDLSRVRTGQLKDDIPVTEGDRISVMSKFAGTAKVYGEVKTPGEKDLTGPIQLREFILASAGGFTDSADQIRVQVLRDGQPVQTVDLLAVAKGVKRSDDPVLAVKPGDQIYVPRGLAMVRGEVKTPGEFPIGSITNIFDFITMKAGGFTENAEKTKVELVRDGGKTRKVLDLSLVAEGRKSYNDPEFALLPGDEISVANNENNAFFVVGAVKKPGKFGVKKAMRLIDALALAEGLDEKADKQIVVVPGDKFDSEGNPITPVLKEGKGKKPPSEKDLAAAGLIVVDRKKLFKGDPASNVAISPGDRILVPAKETREGGGNRGNGLFGALGMLGRVLFFPFGGGGFY